MLFISKEKDDLVVREVPIIAAPVTGIIGAGLIALIVVTHRSEETIGFILASLAMLVLCYVAFGLIRWRRFDFLHATNTVVLRDRYLTRRTRDEFSIDSDAYAEVVITHDDGDAYEAVLVTADKTVPLNDEMSLATSSRIVMALNAWLAQKGT